jgi:3-phosphoshikimate 1-carboxyvinyltransferase
MDILIYPSQFKGTVQIIGSKSLSHRYLIGAALGDSPSQLHNLMVSDDLNATTRLLKALGANIDGPQVHGPLKIEAPLTLDANASGSTLRFLIPLALRFNQTVIFTGKDRLPKRSLKAYEDCFKEHPVTFKRLSEDYLPLEVKGPLTPGTYHIAADLSSQFISGLLFALPFLKGDSVIELSTPIASFPYFQMTHSVLSEFGIEIHPENARIRIPGHQTIKPIEKTIESDYSQALFFLAGALLGGELTLSDLFQNSLQGDKVIVSIFQENKIALTHLDQSIQIKSQPFNGFDLDLDDTPDMAPMLMLMSAFAQTPSIFKNLGRLKEKESNRYDAILDTLTQMNVRFTGDETKTTIHPVSSFESHRPFETFQDHRMAMALLMCAPKATTSYRVNGVECMNKSYPDFLDVYRSIGGKFEIIGDLS